MITYSSNGYIIHEGKFPFNKNKITAFNPKKVLNIKCYEPHPTAVLIKKRMLGNRSLIFPYPDPASVEEEIKERMNDFFKDPLSDDYDYHNEYINKLVRNDRRYITHILNKSYY